MTSDRTLLHAAGQAYAIPDEGGTVPPWMPVDALGKPAGVRAGDVPWTQAPVGVACGETPGLFDDAGLVGRTAEGVVIALRGTRLSISPKRAPLLWVTDWVNNLAIGLTSDGDAPAEEASHGGFRLAAHRVARTLRPQIQAALAAAAKTAPIYVTGHSKGGAMAPFVARWLIAQGLATGRRVVVRTFAAPRLCGAGFRDAYLASGVDHLRYEAFGDVVPMLPLTGPIAWPLLALAPDSVRRNAATVVLAGYVDLGPGRYIRPSGALIDIHTAGRHRLSDLEAIAEPGDPTFLTQHSITRGSTYADRVP
ncbi:MAG: hypothetical protein JNK30_15275 [Phenylobacterium sp.]|uniref:lipase family protein n=1 Tax=Phenylobacterium sp. TaxID=1871053 RepID=UPI001A4F31A2|nr:hypothetical protein [Phenylobacterium sp.]MBL8772743.1 hypothetical protein [Phenylobacterium sp.]